MSEIYPDRPSDSPVMITLAEPGEDRELKAISYISSVLSDFSPAAKYRILGYLNLRFDPPADLSEVQPRRSGQ